MTPSEISEDLERATIFNPNSLLTEAAATIRAQAEALKIATEALERIAHKTGIGNVTCARQALARIKEV